MAAMITAAVAVIVVVCALALVVRRRRFVALVNRLPGPPTLPLLGNALDDMRVPRNQMLLNWSKRHEKYAPIYRTWMGSLPFVHLTKPEHVEVMLRSTVHLEKPWIYNFLHEWLGLGLLTSSGNKWHSRRRLITPAFHFKVLESFCQVFAEQSEILVEKLKAEVTHRGGQGFDVYPFVNRCALDIICKTAMGTEVQAQDDSNSKYVQAVSDIGELIMKRAFSPHLHPDFVFAMTKDGKLYKHSLEVLHSFTKKVIQDRKDEHVKREKNGNSQAHGEDVYLGLKSRLMFLDLLLAMSVHGNTLTDKDMLEEVETFMFEGHDTTTSGTSWALYMIASHPEVQAQVIEELDEIFRGSSRSITMRDVQSMKYLDCVIKETLRLYPSVPYIGRKLLQDIEIGGYTIPAGCTVTTHIFAVHRDPDHFPDPEHFDPDRFMPDRAQGRHPYAFIPFSAGPRNCIGQKFAMLEEKTMVASVLRHFELRAVHDRVQLKLIGELVLKSEAGIHLVLTPRGETLLPFHS